MDVLTSKDKQILNTLIGGEPKLFTKLYSAKLDGCNAQTFHTKCDNRGPTVTLVYNNVGDVYGGYTSVSWLSRNEEYMYDSKAFLFILSTRSESEPMKLPVQNANYATYHDEITGPCFGSGPDLLVFKEEVNVLQVDKIVGLTLNSKIDSKDYKFHPTSLGRNVSNDFTVRDVVVYNVEDNPTGKLDTPWSEEPLFTDSYLETLLSDVESYWPLKDMGVDEGSLEYVNILMVGPIGAGKSSFYNTVNSVFRNRATMSASAGSRDRSVTMRYTMYPFWCTLNTKKNLKFRICDCRGVDGEFHIGRDIDAIIDGHIPNGFDLGSSTGINTKTPGYQKNPGLEDKIHCVAFVLDANNNTGDSPFVPAESMEQIKEVQRKLDDRGIPQRILLSKVDGACSLTRESTANVYSSSIIRDRCIQAAKCLGLPPFTVLPMKNIYLEKITPRDVKILALYNLRSLLYAANDYLETNHLSELRDDKYENSVVRGQK